MWCGVVSSGPVVVLSVGSPGQPVIVVPLGGNTNARVVNLQAEGGGTLPKSAGGGGRSDNNDKYDGLPRGAPRENHQRPR